MRFRLFSGPEPRKTYNKEKEAPVLRCSICTGEQVACFKDTATGELREVMLIRGDEDLAAFRREYGIEGDIEKVY